jgi:hypothetical protein
MVSYPRTFSVLMLKFRGNLSLALALVFGVTSDNALLANQIT